MLFNESLAEKLEGTDVTANTLHSGAVDTKLLRNNYDIDGVGVEEGARTSVYLASSPDVAQVSGKYFEKIRERSASDPSQNKVL